MSNKIFSKKAQVSTELAILVLSSVIIATLISIIYFKNEIVGVKYLQTYSNNSTSNLLEASRNISGKIAREAIS
ncbi:Protein of unknown function DUF361 [Methanocaldococcus vulcanius M7]|uniref:Uncharacterized protein n=1 Tax=Methanocaldococcus vulcanius (strain ATCC 700851 / DSM 12094 / M7) TaxID=579137 RepID=C9RI65_METVM|nr:hypothetical protein [Methanocaldococcus vulcanius]ACX73267.1 Protein of unknown function DUF361 [Methanocaldococcus vulcanius M7]